MNYLKIKYADANLNQIKKAQEEFIKKRNMPANKILHIETQKDLFERYPSYDKNGNLTLVGKAKRLTDLQKQNLDKNTTIEEYYTNVFSNVKEKIINFCKFLDNN